MCADECATINQFATVLNFFMVMRHDERSQATLALSMFNYRMAVKSIVKYLVIFIIILLGWNVDFTNVTFRLHGAARDLPDTLFFLGATILAVVAALRLVRRRYMRLFFWMSGCFTLHHAIWFQIGQSFYIDAILIWQSEPYFIEAWQEYARNFGFATIFWHGFMFIMVYLFFLFIAVITEKLRIVWQAMMEEIRKGK